MKKKNQPDLFVRYMAGTPYIIVCTGLAFFKVSEIILPVVVVYITIYILCFAILAIIFTLFFCIQNNTAVDEIINSSITENGTSPHQILLIEKRYYENVIGWVFEKAFWASFTTTAIIMIKISPYL